MLSICDTIGMLGNFKVRHVARGNIYSLEENRSTYFSLVNIIDIL